MNPGGLLPGPASASSRWWGTVDKEDVSGRPANCSDEEEVPGKLESLHPPHSPGGA